MPSPVYDVIGREITETTAQICLPPGNGKEDT